MSGEIKINYRLPARESPTGKGTRLMQAAPGLQAARQAANMSVEELAAATDLPIGTITNLENGGFEVILRVSSLQGYLFGLTEIDIKEEPS